MKNIILTKTNKIVLELFELETLRTQIPEVIKRLEDEKLFGVHDIITAKGPINRTGDWHNKSTKTLRFVELRQKYQNNKLHNSKREV